MTNLYKLGWLPEGQDGALTEERFEYGNTWAKEQTTGPARLVIAPRSHHVELLGKLADCLESPFLLLYVLSVPRGGGEAGRYQNNYSFSALQVREFLSSYSAFLEGDARHSLWIRSSDEGMLVYDPHNVIYAYGPLERFVAALEVAGLMESNEVRFPSPHMHRYHAEFDADENRLLRNKEWWTISPLRDSDD